MGCDGIVFLSGDTMYCSTNSLSTWLISMGVAVVVVLLVLLLLLLIRPPTHLVLVHFAISFA